MKVLRLHFNGYAVATSMNCGKRRTATSGKWIQHSVPSERKQSYKPLG
jgi:hypothetical protein